MENERSTIPPNAADEDASTPRGSVGITSGGRICVGDGGIHRHKDGQACACNRQVGRNRGRLAAECVGGRKRDGGRERREARDRSRSGVLLWRGVLRPSTFKGVRMAHGRGGVTAERIVALASAREPSHSKTELYSCLALLFGAIATLTAVVTYLAMAPGAPVAPSNLSGARSLLASLGLVTSVLAFFS